MELQWLLIRTKKGKIHDDTTIFIVWFFLRPNCDCFGYCSLLYHVYEFQAKGTGG